MLMFLACIHQHICVSVFARARVRLLVCVCVCVCTGARMAETDVEIGVFKRPGHQGALARTSICRPLAATTRCMHRNSADRFRRPHSNAQHSRKCRTQPNMRGKVAVARR